MQINISGPVRSAILAEVHEGGRNLFVSAQEEVYRLMDSDAVPKFLHSPECAMVTELMREQ
jgi:hypothetical protein